MTIIYLGFIVASERNTYQANTPGDNAESRTGNIGYTNELEGVMARVAILILTCALSSLSFSVPHPISLLRSDLGAAHSC